jgi:hypothetical protein
MNRIEKRFPRFGSTGYDISPEAFLQQHMVFLKLRLGGDFSARRGS